MIGKTRHAKTPISEQASIALRSFAQGCGVLRHSQPVGSYRHERYTPPQKLGSWIEHFWLETWQFSTPERREMLPHPSVHLVFSGGRSRVYGVQSGRFVRELKSAGRVFGVKFRPGSFYPFLKKPVCSITDTITPGNAVFAGADQAAERMLACRDESEMLTIATEFLEKQLPPSDRKTEVVRRAVAEIISDRELRRVQQLLKRVGVRERSLQRLFRLYVGVSPRWVINRYRMYEALEQLAGVTPTPLADLAQLLGYFDQAHFSNDFRNRVGRAPAQYARAAGEHDWSAPKNGRAKQ